MGSLMAGWGSNVQDPAAVKFQRNHSLTRDEIDTYWKSKKQKEEEHNKIVSEETGRSVEKSYQRSSSVPLSTTDKRILDMGDDSEGSLEKLIHKNGWWMSSNSAFLNEPPVLIPLPEGEKHQHKKFACGKYGCLQASRDTCTSSSTSSVNINKFM